MIIYRSAENRVKECQQQARRMMGKLAPGEEAWVWWSILTQQWVQQVQEADKVFTLPQEYWWHQHVFSEGAQHFPLKREGELGIPLMPEAPKVLDCKVYPLTKEEQDLLHTFLAKKRRRGIFIPAVLCTPPQYSS
jgi:hypothetical protein